MPAERLRLGRLAIALAVAACSTPSVDASAPPYDPTALTGGLIYHWPLGRAIAFHVPSADPFPDAALRAAARAGAERWTAALGYGEHRLHLVEDLAIADVVIRDARTPSPVETSCGGYGWTDGAGSAFFCPLGDTARTLSLVSGGGGRTKILLTIAVAALPDGTSLDAVVAHEIGHALGIGGHSPVASDVMFGAPQARVPSPRDARTLRYLLHRRPDLTL